MVVMQGSKGFTDRHFESASILTELIQLEPIFHTSAFGLTPLEFTQRMAPDYWEVGASGRRYSREFILQHLAQNPPADAAASGWACYDYGLRQLSPDTYLLTYTLLQGERLTRRATIWNRSLEGWRILYHQGTIVAADEDG